ncbi:MAG: phosphomannomutase/phosphoglucomutase [Clostridiales bacterium]|nr:phosphomannomutase/phosphoglucomutase [Clostridiales bacterium]
MAELTKAFNSMFREYDIRGRVSDEELCPDNVYRIVKAYSKYLQTLGIKKAVVGYDNRDCSIGFADAAVKALREFGIDVCFIGLALSPLTYFAQYYLKCEGAVMITASHNPSGWSGFKLAKGYSMTLEPDDIKAVYALVDTDDEKYKPEKEGGYEEINVRDAYINDIVSRIKMGPKKPKVVLDAGNGGAGVFIYEVFQKLGCMTFQLHCDPDMTYPNYFPNPSDLKGRAKLKEMVTHPYIKADLGLSFDGDGDRLGVIDNNGNNIWSDTILAYIAKNLLKRKKGATVVYDVKCSRSLTEVIEQNGGNPVMWKTGHSYIKSKMHELNADLAGERSGHIFIGGDDYYGFDDAVFVGAKLVEALSNDEDNISEAIAKFPQYVTSPEIKAHCADELKYGIVEKIVETFKERYPGKVFDINGARVSFDNGWGLVRASSNLPELVLIFEAVTEDELRKIRAVFKEVLSAYPEISEKWDNDIYDD